MKTFISQNTPPIREESREGLLPDHPLLKFAALVALIGIASGCGNIFQNNMLKVPKSDVSGGMTAPSLTTNGLTESYENQATYNCPTASNVNPDYDWDFNGTGYYTVCPAKANTSDVLIHGTYKAQTTICAFPAFVSGSGSSYTVYTKPDFSQPGNPPLSKCTTPGSTGAYLSFDASISYNALFIVDQADQAQMTSCLDNGGNYLLCPHYSFGQFR